MDIKTECSKEVLISQLKHSKYDHLPKPAGDGVTDDTMIIQARINAGLDPFCGASGDNYLISETLILK